MNKFFLEGESPTLNNFIFMFHCFCVIEEGWHITKLNNRKQSAGPLRLDVIGGYPLKREFKGNTLLYYKMLGKRN